MNRHRSTKTLRTGQPGRARRARGFTLVELIVVILIIAILAALVVPNLLSRVGQAKRAKAAGDISTIAGALTLFRTDNDRYPTTEEGLTILRNPPPDVTGATRQPYITKEIPLDPWGQPYQYEWPGPLGEYSFTLRSLGADGAPGGEGDAADISEGDQ